MVVDMGEGMKVNLDCQVDRMFNHYGNKALATFFREFLDWVS